jgi:hypothetical protein
VRNALILLAVVAGIILVAGAFNNGVVFDIDYVAGTATKVSLFWVSGIVAAIIFVAGLAASWFALSSAGGARRKLEAELQSTYERLRQTESQADDARAAATAAEARTLEAQAAALPEATAVDEREAVTIVEETVAETVVVDEAETVVAGEAETATATPDDGADTVVVPPEDDATLVVAGEETAGGQTAVTMVTDSTPESGAAEAGAGEEPDESDAAPGAKEGPAAS